MFAPIYGINTRKIYNKIKELGYKFTNFIHDSTHIWHPKPYKEITYLYKNLIIFNMELP